MPAIARGGVDDVLSPHGRPSPRSCATPGVYKTIAITRRAFVEGYPIVLVGDPMEAHPDPASNCGLHAPTLSNGSSRIFYQGIPVGRIGDSYNQSGNHPIISGSIRCFSN
jgi:uncharacterized Zn-binding protein involved in type VI secretion